MLRLLGFNFPSNWWELLHENGDKSLHSQALELTVRACAAKKGVSTTMVLEHRISSTQKRRARLPGLLAIRLPSWVWRPSDHTYRAARCQQWQWRGDRHPPKSLGGKPGTEPTFSLSPGTVHANVSRYSQQSFSSVNFRESDTSL